LQALTEYEKVPAELKVKLPPTPAIPGAPGETVQLYEFGVPLHVATIVALCPTNNVVALAATPQVGTGGGGLTPYTVILANSGSLELMLAQLWWPRRMNKSGIGFAHVQYCVALFSPPHAKVPPPDNHKQTIGAPVFCHVIPTLQVELPAAI
jgi:hypothetical protein